MLDRRRPPEHVALELAALRIEHEFYSNLVVRLADLLYCTPAERNLLHQLQAEMTEIAAWAVSIDPSRKSPRVARTTGGLAQEE